MSTVMMGKVDGKRRRGRPPTSYIINVVDASSLKMQKSVHKCRDRSKRISVVELQTSTQTMENVISTNCEEL